MARPLAFDADGSTAQRGDGDSEEVPGVGHGVRSLTATTSLRDVGAEQRTDGVGQVQDDYNGAMEGSTDDIDALLRITPIFRKLAPADRLTVAGVAAVRRYEKGELIFEQGAPSDSFYTIASGRVKIFKRFASGKDLILEVFGPGDPLGAIATYDGRPFPASAAALEETVCVVLGRSAFFTLLEQHPSLVRGLLAGMTVRLVELTNRIGELSGGRIEPRFARLFLKLGSQMGSEERGGIFIPLALSRQELADMTGTTIETAIRIMSRWGKQEVVRSEKDGFVILDRRTLEATGAE
jgi:CRP-like cAMP-binding protein